MKAWWGRLSRRSKIVTVVVALVVIGALGSVGNAPSTQPAVAAASLAPAPSVTATPPSSAATTTEATASPSAIATPEPTVDPTAEPTPDPTPQPTPEAAFATIKLSGHGTKIAKFRIPEDEAAIASITNRGSSNFAVWTVGDDGSQQELLVNEIGNYKGTVLFDVDTHSVAFKIESNGSWAVTIAPVVKARVWNTTQNLAGTGDGVVQLRPASSGFATTNVVHKGSSNFVVYTYNLSGRELQVNEIGRYRGEILLPDGTILIQVMADGTWTFTPPK